MSLNHFLKNKIDNQCFDCAIIIDNDDDYYTTIYETMICEDCFNEKYIKCDNCSECALKKEDDEYFIVNNINYCKNCYFDIFEECNAAKCQKIIKKEDANKFDNEYYCNDCFKQYFKPCEECNDYLPFEDLVHSKNEKLFCKYCYNTLYVNCSKCKAEIEKKDIKDYILINNKYYCNNCYSKFSD